MRNLFLGNRCREKWKKKRKEDGEKRIQMQNTKEKKEIREEWMEEKRNIEKKREYKIVGKKIK